MKYNITPKEVYEILSSNEEILNIYKNIEIREIKGKGLAFHNLEHVKSVTKIAEQVLLALNYDDNMIYKCKIACLLHDIGALQGKEEHAMRSFTYAQELFKKNNWAFEDEDLILEVIKNHSNSYDTDNIIALTIILADKLDIKKTRITEEGKKVEGNRQYQHIEDIIINIKEEELTVKFITDKKLDIKEFNEYYFNVKVFNAIKSFASKLNLKYDVLIDDAIWSI